MAVTGKGLVIVKNDLPDCSKIDFNDAGGLGPIEPGLARRLPSQ
jgi:hypothetical protein